VISGGAEDEALSAMLGLAVCYARRRQWAKAEATLLRVCARAPELACARAYLGAVRFEQGCVEAARADLDAAVALAPNDPIARCKRGEMLFRLGLLQEALVDLQWAASLPAPDAATRDHIRALVMATKKELGSAATRTVASPAAGWRRMRAWWRGRHRTGPAQSAMTPADGVAP